MLDQVGNPNCWFSQAQAHFRKDAGSLLATSMNNINLTRTNKADYDAFLIESWSWIGW